MATTNDLEREIENVDIRNYTERNVMNKKHRGFIGLCGLGLAIAVALATFAFAAPGALADEPIVGLWDAVWRDANTNSLVLRAWDVWHSDRTETQNDTGPVIAGFVCQGAWKPLGDRTYFLTHPSFDYTGADGHWDLTSSVVIYEKVTVSRDGNSFSGTGEFRTYSTPDPFDPAGTLLSTEPITITATRVIPDPSQLP